MAAAVGCQDLPLAGVGATSERFVMPGTVGPGGRAQAGDHNYGIHQM